ncbi:MAG: protein methyltransferase [Deltaproteobacteria bacterium HGW-Deltaproteobacteria-15]|jgi:predicted nicotinamide N-methyase|nr:MAG: protein methyltransferase [Deltaproteobacteria bacterium HGW-Deltaproteobacteria-15]
MNDRTQKLFTYLQEYLQSRVPGSRLEKTQLPQVPELSLYLMNEDYPRDSLSRKQVLELMDDPPYWCFCWASGQVLGRYVLDNPDWVRGKTVVDLGAGSGVVGMAAKLVGAKRVILCDLDEKALLAGELNGQINGVGVGFSSSIEEILEENVNDWIITAADVFYDPENLPLLETMLGTFGAVLVSDSRLKGQPLQGMDIIGGYDSHTVPDLDESREFNRVTLYRSRQ